MSKRSNSGSSSGFKLRSMSFGKGGAGTKSDKTTATPQPTTYGEPASLASTGYQKRSSHGIDITGYIRRGLRPSKATLPSAQNDTHDQDGGASLESISGGWSTFKSPMDPGVSGNGVGTVPSRTAYGQTQYSDSGGGQLQDKLVRLEKENDELRVLNVELTAREKSYLKKISRIDEEKSDYRIKTQKQSQEIQQYSKQNSELSDMIKRMEAEQPKEALQSMEMELDRLRKKNSEQEAEIKQIKAENRRLERKKIDSDTKLKTLQGENDDLRQKNIEADRNLINGRNQSNELRKTNSAHKMKIHTMTLELNHLKAENSELKGSLQSKEDELAELHEKDTKSTNQIREMYNSIIGLERYYSDTKPELARLKNELTQTRQRHAELDDTIEGMAQELEQLRAANAKLKQELDSSITEAIAYGNNRPRSTHDDAYLSSELGVLFDRCQQWALVFCTRRSFKAENAEFLDAVMVQVYEAVAGAGDAWKVAFAANLRQTMECVVVRFLSQTVFNKQKMFGFLHEQFFDFILNESFDTSDEKKQKQRITLMQSFEASPKFRQSLETTINNFTTALFDDICVLVGLTNPNEDAPISKKKSSFLKKNKDMLSDIFQSAAQLHLKMLQEPATFDFISVTSADPYSHASMDAVESLDVNHSEGGFLAIEMGATPVVTKRKAGAGNPMVLRKAKVYLAKGEDLVEKTADQGARIIGMKEGRLDERRTDLAEQEVPVQNGMGMWALNMMLG